jgi:hypothetical protein
MQSIKRLLYSLKRHYGTPIDFYQEIENQPDPTTGKKITSRIKYSIPLGIFIDQTLTLQNPLYRALKQLVGMLDVSKVNIFFDSNDLKSDYIPTIRDYVIIHNQRYEINSIRQVDNNQSYWLTLTEYKGSQLFQQYDILIKDKLTLVQKFYPIHNYRYHEELIDDLLLVETLNTNIVSNQTINDVLEFNEAIQSD